MRSHLWSSGAVVALAAVLLAGSSCGASSSPVACADVAEEAGEDVGEPELVPECGSDAECDDGNPCTGDLCVDGTCSHEVNETDACDDKNACTIDDSCLPSAVCAGTPVSCNDADPCTEDSCNPETGCQHKLLPEWTPCDDGNLCTLEDSCADGACSGTPKNCSDGNGCTTEACVPETGECLVVNDDGAQCDDGDVCTSKDTCSAGTCAGGPALDCDDGNLCTDDGCKPKEGCWHTDNTAPCDDGSLCTQTDACADGACVGKNLLQCNDENVCTKDSCQPEVGCIHEPFSTPCNDGNSCTVDDHCEEGQCVSGGLTLCDDGNPCTVEACDPVTGECVYAQTGGDCDDGNLCTTGDTCMEGLCVGSPVVCDDSNECTSDSCAPLTGCLHAAVDGQCDDGNVCTLGDVCVAGACAAGAQPLSCDDGNPCTEDLCNPLGGTGCDNVPTSAPCDDNNPCTAGDACDDGACKPGAVNVCFCQSDADCLAQDDDDLCNGKLVCDVAVIPHVCVLEAGSVVICPTDEDTQCKKNLCSSTSGTCALTPVNQGMPCNDGNACTQEDECQKGKCTGFPVVCLDANPCTDDVCSPETGCQFVFNTLPCDDGLACSPVDQCGDGTCQPKVFQSCDDANACTDDACLDSKSGCVNVPNVALCNDGSLCTWGDVCSAGVCAGKTVSCDDDNPCTDEICTPEQGCLYTPNTLPCDDGNPCTEQTYCLAGTCSNGVSVVCNDGNPCTDDACDAAAGGCVFKPNTLPCDDGSLCSESDHCSAGVCSGTPANCDDGNVCTDDLCAPEQGCYYVNNNLSCSDSDACTKGDRCVWGACAPTSTVSCQDASPCTQDACDPKTGVCSHVPMLGDCDDKTVCTTGDTCQAGKCVGTPIECGDNNPCTSDSCDAETGCKNAPVSGTCNDGDACTGPDVCGNGVCAGPQVSCDDANVCTGDSCDPKVGCSHAILSGPCDDGNPATTLDTCAAAKCVGLPDADKDGVPDSGFLKTCGDGQTVGCNDNCPGVANAGQGDWNADALGDACDPCKPKELCNGLDDDCDGLKDEGFPGLGQKCDWNDADLCRMGTLACSQDGLSTVCTETGAASIYPLAPAQDAYVAGRPAAVSYPLSGATSVNGAQLTSVYGGVYSTTKYVSFEIPLDVFAFSLGQYIHREEPDLRFFATVDVDKKTVEVSTQGQFRNLPRFFGPAQAIDTYGLDTEHKRDMPAFLASHTVAWMGVEGYLPVTAGVDLTKPSYHAYAPDGATYRLYFLGHETKECCDGTTDNHNVGEQSFTVSSLGLVAAFHYGRTANDRTLNDSWIYRAGAMEAHARDCCAGDVISRSESTASFLMQLKLARFWGSAYSTWYLTGIAQDMAATKALDLFDDWSIGRGITYRIDGLTPAKLAAPSADPSVVDSDVVVLAGSCDVLKTYTAPVGEAFHKIYLRIWTSPQSGGSSHWYYVEGRDSQTLKWQRIMESAAPASVLLDSYDLFAKTGRVFDKVHVSLASDCSAAHNNPGHFEVKLYSAKFTPGAAVRLTVAGRDLPPVTADGSGMVMLAFPADQAVDVAVDGQTVCSGLVHDSDGDGVADDGSSSGLAGDLPCKGSASACDDNCPSVANLDQKDTDGDGTGDACE